MKKSLSFIIFIALATSIYAQIEVSGNQSGTWTSDNSPYLVVGEITIPSGQTLNIEAGVEVNFQGHFKFTVLGKLEAIGTESDSIFFTTDNQATGWGGIRFEYSSQISSLSYCRIEFGKTSGDYPDIHGGAMAFLGSDAVVSNCVFADNEATADDTGMGGAIYANGTGSTSGPLTFFTDCKFLRNHAYGEGGAIKFTGDMNTEITGCEFIENDCNYGGGAISCYSVYDTKIIYCLFADNYTMYSNGGAVNSLGVGNSIFFKNCTLTDNSAVTGDGGAVNLAYADVDFVNCIVYDNPGMYSDNIYLDFGGYAEINYCNLIMPDGATGSNNMNENPQFVDSGNYNFHLDEDSPCIDAGTDIGYEYVGEAPDMGCYEYGMTTGLIDSRDMDLSIYPNPTNDFINFDIVNTHIQTIIISDLTGKNIIEETVLKENQRIDLSDMQRGIYLLTIKTDNKTLTKKIVKE
jgi:hypothetical protein